MSNMSLNKVLLIGRLGRDPEHKLVVGGKKVTRFSLALSSKYKDSHGSSHEQTDWITVVCWNELADITSKINLAKGDLVYVEAKISTRSFNDQNTGKPVHCTEFTANRIQLLSRPNASTTNGYGHPAEELSQEYDNSPSIDDDDMPF